MCPGRASTSIAEVAAARLVVVDAINESAATFYERFGFLRTPKHPLRLYRRMKDIRASLDAFND